MQSYKKCNLLLSIYWNIDSHQKFGCKLKFVLQSILVWKGVIINIYIYIYIYILYRIAGKFGGELNLAVWWSILQPPN